MASLSQQRDNAFSVPPNDMVDVAIVGYGPVGQALALRLAQYGHRVVVIERWSNLYGLPRAVGLDHETMRILQSLRIMDALEPATCLSQRYEWRNGEGEVLKAFPALNEIDASGWPSRCSFSQPDLERFLDDKVCTEYGHLVTVHRNVTVTGAVVDPEKVVLETRSTVDMTTNVTAGTATNSAAQPQHIAARYVVGCDGAGSFVRNAMGVPLDRLGFAADWLVVDLLPRDLSQWNADVVQICDPQRPTTLVPGGPLRRRFEFMMLEGEKKEDFADPQAVWPLLERWGWTPTNAILERHAIYTFGAAVARTWRLGKLMIAGDAAHLTPPFAAQGLCAGLRDVAALSWRLDAVLHKRAPETLLDSYGMERREHATVFVEFAVMLGKIICVLDPDVAAERDRQFRNDDGRGEQGWPAPRLGDSPLLRKGDDATGRLGVQGRVAYQGREGRFDDLVGTGFVLIGHEHDPSAMLNDAQRAFVNDIGVTVIGVGKHCEAQDIDGTYARWFEALGSNAVLVRPDFYLFGSGNAKRLVEDLMQAWVSTAASTVQPVLQAS